jgi:hypothetical protein
MIEYGQTISWHDRDGTQTAISCQGHSSREAALKDALEGAISSGWTPPRWWQWWRWGEIDYSKLVQK